MPIAISRRKFLQAALSSMAFAIVDPVAEGAGMLLSMAARLHRAAPSFLDGISPSPSVALSLRKLISTATIAIRVRRSSDNAEMDIGFTRNELDKTALLAFAAGGSAYVTTFYDQTGNGKHAAQAMASAQPKIVNAGAYLGLAVFDGSTSWMKITSFANGTPYLGVYTRIKQPNVTSNKIIIEATTNYNTAAQAFLMFVGLNGSTSMWSVNACNAAGSQRTNQFVPTSVESTSLLTALWDRTITGTDEQKMFAEGERIIQSFNPQTVEQTGNFGTFDTYIGARAGSSLFADMSLDTLVLYASDTASVRTSIEQVIGNGDYLWPARLNAPTHFMKLGSTYFCCDCWHQRLIYSDDIKKPITQWSVLDEKLFQPHNIASDGYLYVTENTESSSSIRTYKSDGTGGFTTLQTTGSLGSRPHRVQYDAATSSFYVICGYSQNMLRFTRSGDVITQQSNVTLGFLGGQYTRGFRIYDGKMYIVCEPGKVYEVSFDGVSTYTLLNTYTLPTGMESPNDIFRDSTGTWYATATNQAMIRFTSLAAMDAGTYDDVMTEFGLAGTPYYLEEFDGALWIPEIIQRNGLTAIVNGRPQLIHNYGTENASDLARHNVISFP